MDRYEVPASDWHELVAGVRLLKRGAAVALALVLGGGIFGLEWVVDRSVERALIKFEVLHARAPAAPPAIAAERTP